MLDKDIESVLISQTDIQNIVSRLGREITRDYHDRFPIVLGLLKGCVPFMAELLKVLDFHLEVAFMNVSSYHGGIESTGDVRIDMDLASPVKGRHVLLTEDIIDTGRTIKAVSDLLLYRGAASVKVVTLMDKPEGRIKDFVPDYIGRSIPKIFVVGFGLDYEERYRNLPYVGVLKEHVYTTKE